MNRRLRELEREKVEYTRLRDEADTISDTLLYQGKLESVEREIQGILKRYEVTA